LAEPSLADLWKRSRWAGSSATAMNRA